MEHILIENVDEYCATLEFITHSGDIRVQPAYQVSNDGRTWYSGATSAAADTFATFGTNRTTAGLTYATTFGTLAPSEKKKWVRFGVVGKNGTAGKPEAGLVTLRIDTRSP